MLPVMLLIPSASAAITLTGAKCGTKICEPFQYCGEFHSNCEDCSRVCDVNMPHNFEEEICYSKCQNYLYDSRFVKLTNYTDDIKQLKNQQMIILIILVVLLILFVLTNGVKFGRWLKNNGFPLSWKKFLAKKKNEKPKESVVQANPHTESPKMRQKQNHADNPQFNRSSSVFSVSGTEIEQKTVSTPISTRYPAEDTTLAYAYDNQALAITPVSEKPRGTETAF